MTGDVLPDSGRLAERKVGIWIGAEGGAPGMNGAKPEPAAERSGTERSGVKRSGAAGSGLAE